MQATRPIRQRALTILWPAFLMAGVLEMLVFSMVDPGQLHWFGGEALEFSPAAVYTAAFFVFWGVVAAAGVITRLLDGDPEDINREGFSGAFRR
ncbi:hypothetical protein [Ideonella sp. A 288]|uniref:hypothetical protein n=1 Tax=Ideonella sp. A 288 TaxID=1962181 RepID=UPI000B4BC48D|nr:hypothetical protein [Ideonella sp. A 288]